MTTRSKTKLYTCIFLENRYQFERGANYPNDIKIMHLGLFRHLQVRQTRRQSFAVTITKITNKCLKVEITIKQLPNWHTKLEKVF